MERPSLTYTMTVNEERKVIKMTYALHNEILSVIPEPDRMAELLITNPGLRDYIARRLITGNKPVEKDEDLVNLYELDVDLDEIAGLISWAGDHVLYFFLNSAAKAAELGKKYEETIAQLSQSKNGTESSASTTPSAGASDAVKEISTISSGDTPTTNS